MIISWIMNVFHKKHHEKSRNLWWVATRRASLFHSRLAIPNGDPGQVDLDGLFCGGHMQPVLILTSEAVARGLGDLARGLGPRGLGSRTFDSRTCITAWWLWFFTGSPLKNDGLSQSVGMMKLLNGKIKNYPNHQPDHVNLPVGLNLKTIRCCRAFSLYVEDVEDPKSPPNRVWIRSINPQKKVQGFKVPKK